MPKDKTSLYENYKLCDRLTASEICLVVEQYQAGEIIRKFHEHIPWYRISKDNLGNLLRTLVFHYSGESAQIILSSSLNKRAKFPSATPLLCQISYPEPRVLRTYIGSDTIAWSDQVISPNFRSQEVG